MDTYARLLHRAQPAARLLIWADTHYDTISPLVKDTAGIGFDQYVPVQNGGGVVIRLTQEGHTMYVQGQQLPLHLGEITAEVNWQREL